MAIPKWLTKDVKTKGGVLQTNMLNKDHFLGYTCANYGWVDKNCAIVTSLSCYASQLIWDLQICVLISPARERWLLCTGHTV